MNKHTRGPWETDGAGDRQDYDVAILARTPTHGNPRWIARVYGQGSLVKRHPETVANARLIAAAPDLLGACKRIYAYSSQFVDDSSRGQFNSILREAIAKAEGKEL